MAFGGGSSKGVRSDINITPLVDVVLVLLIIFMVMTPILLKQMDVQVPEKSDVAIVAEATDQLVLKIAADGALALNNDPVQPEQLADRVSSVLSGRSDKLMFFDIDDEANYADVVHVMDTCRGAGVKTLGLMTR